MKLVLFHQYDQLLAKIREVASCACEVATISGLPDPMAVRLRRQWGRRS